MVEGTDQAAEDLFWGADHPASADAGNSRLQVSARSPFNIEANSGEGKWGMVLLPPPPKPQKKIFLGKFADIYLISKILNIIINSGEGEDIPSPPNPQ